MDGFFVAKQLELLAAIADVDSELALNQAQVLVVLAAHVGETGGFKAIQGKAVNRCRTVQEGVWPRFADEGVCLVAGPVGVIDQARA